MCGSIVASPPLASLAEAAETYARYHEESSFSAPDSANASLERLVSMAEGFRKSGRWLDLGFGEGALLSIAERHGWACFGTEVSPHALGFGIDRRWTVTTDPAADPRFERASFDVVTMIEVLEHVTTPRAFMREAADWLRPGGLLYLTTPNARSLNRWILGANWSIVCPPEHLTIWTAAGVRRLLALNELRCISLRAEGFNPAEMIAHLRPGVNASQVHRQSAGVALSRALSGSGPRRALKATANAVLALLGVGDTLKVKCVKEDAART
jgi:SAM-dependent methyltransferase